MFKALQLHIFALLWPLHPVHEDDPELLLVDAERHRAGFRVDLDKRLFLLVFISCLIHIGRLVAAHKLIMHRVLVQRRQRALLVAKSLDRLLVLGRRRLLVCWSHHLHRDVEWDARGHLGGDFFGVDGQRDAFVQLRVARLAVG